MSTSWSPQEQQMLKKLVQVEKLGWKEISGKLAIAFPNKSREAKQCRERYTDYVCYSGSRQITKRWRQSQMMLFIEIILEFGLSWNKICDSFTSKEEHFHKMGRNCFKNYYYSSLKIFMKKINRKLRDLKKAEFKQTPFRRFFNIGISELHSNLDSNYTQIIKKSLEMIITRQGILNTQQIEYLQQYMHKFNCQNRHLNAKKLLAASGEFRKRVIIPKLMVMDDQLKIKSGDIQYEGEQIKVECIDNFNCCQNQQYTEKSDNLSVVFLPQKSPEQIFIDAVLSL